MQVYKVTNAERLILENIIGERNIILIVCDFGGSVGCAVDYASLTSDSFTSYLEAIAPLDEARIVEVNV
jgi:hypothetical protein